MPKLSRLHFFLNTCLLLALSQYAIAFTYHIDRDYGLSSVSPEAIYSSFVHRCRNHPVFDDRKCHSYAKLQDSKLMLVANAIARIKPAEILRDENPLQALAIYKNKETCEKSDSGGLMVFIRLNDFPKKFLSTEKNILKSNLMNKDKSGQFIRLDYIRELLPEVFPIGHGEFWKKNYWRKSSLWKQVGPKSRAWIYLEAILKEKGQEIEQGTVYIFQPKHTAGEQTIESTFIWSGKVIPPSEKLTGYEGEALIGGIDTLMPDGSIPNEPQAVEKLRQFMHKFYEDYTRQKDTDQVPNANSGENQVEPIELENFGENPNTLNEKKLDLGDIQYNQQNVIDLTEERKEDEQRPMDSVPIVTSKSIRKKPILVSRPTKYNKNKKPVPENKKSIFDTLDHASQMDLFIRMNLMQPRTKWSGNPLPDAPAMNQNNDAQSNDISEIPVQQRFTNNQGPSMSLSALQSLMNTNEEDGPEATAEDPPTTRNDIEDNSDVSILNDIPQDLDWGKLWSKLERVDSRIEEEDSRYPNAGSMNDLEAYGYGLDDFDKDFPNGIDWKDIGTPDQDSKGQDKSGD